MTAGPQVVVVVPARDEEERVGACLEALAAQEHMAAGSWAVVLVTDGCVDATAFVARRTAGATGLALEVVEGPNRGVGHARALGMVVAAERLRRGVPPPDPGEPRSTAEAGVQRARVIASTDADTVVAPDWLARILDAVDRGAQGVGGRILLDPREAAALPPAVLVARAVEAERRLAAVRLHTPEAEHHQFSGASLALTLEAYDRIGGLPRVAALEDEALERALRAAALPIAFAARVSVSTSARTAGQVPRGLAQVLRTAAWRAAADRDRQERLRADAPLGPGAWTVVHAGVGGRGDAIHAALGAADDVVLVLGPGVDEAQAAPLAAALHADPGLQLVRADETQPDPLAELVARPALNLHVPELAVLGSPLTRTWAARRDLLEALSLPHGDAVDLTVLVDAWRRHGLHAIAERAVAAPPAGPRADPPLAAFELLAALTTRLPGPPALSSAFSDASSTRRARLDEHAPLAAASPDGGPPAPSPPA